MVPSLFSTGHPFAASGRDGHRRRLSRCSPPVPKLLEEILGGTGFLRSVFPEEPPRLVSESAAATFKVGDGSKASANAFVSNVASHMGSGVQISTGGPGGHVSAIENASGADADDGQIIKTFGREESDNRRYRPPEVIAAEREVISGPSDVDLISSYVERLNATTRPHIRRLTRLTPAFREKGENSTTAVGLHFACYNFVRPHNTLHGIAAMAAGITRDFRSVGDLVEAAA